MIEMNVGIIGGSDGLGKTLIYYFKDEFNVFITSRDHNKGQQVADEMGAVYIESNEELARLSDILIISVPINFTSEVIRQVAPFMKDGSLMVDVTSIKEEPSMIMGEAVKDTVEYIPTHPIFGPRTMELDNQVIVLTPQKKGKWYEKVYNYLAGKNMRIIETTAEKHDFMMSIVQVLTHFSFISTASAIEKLKVDLNESEDFESPIYNLMIDMIARIVSQNPYLTYYIQTMNNNGPKIRNTFAEAVVELRDAINNDEEDRFIDIAVNATRHMGDIQNALGRSDKAINALSHEFTMLNKSIGKEVGLKHIYSGRVHVGTLKAIKDKTAILKRGSKTEQLRIANIEVLSDEELHAWKVENYQTNTQTISCQFIDTVSKYVILNTIRHSPNVISAELVETYIGPQIDDGHVSLTFRVTALTKNDVENIKNLLVGFGGKIR